MARRRFLQYSLATLLIFSLCCGAAMTWWHGRHARWAADLAIPERRDEALFKLLKNQKTHTPSTGDETVPDSLADCVVNLVVVSPQVSGPPFYAVFKNWSVSGGKDQAIGHVILFDGNGFRIPWYWNSNVLGENDAIFDVPSGPPKLVLGHVPYTSMDVLYVTELSARHDTPILRIAFNRSPSNKRNAINGAWGYRLAKTANEIAIELGPLAGTETSTEIHPKVRFIWSNAERKFLGPKGGVYQEFMLLTSGTAEPLWDEMEKFETKSESLRAPSLQQTP